MRTLILLVVLSNFTFAQYDSTMYDLIKTTYKRSFDTHIINKYLNSNSEQKTKAAILSIAQSEDTSFVPELLKLDLMKFGSEICFALAQIGKCEQSINFLWKYLDSSPLPESFPKIFFSIGKIGDENDLKKLIEYYNSFDGPIFPYEGISEAILQFQIRGIKSDDAKAILENEITQSLTGASRVIKSLFVLSRYGGSENLSPEIEKFLNESFFENGVISKDTEFKQFVLMNIYSYLNPSLEKIRYNEKTDLRNTLLKIFLSKVLNFLHFKNSVYPIINLDEYYSLLSDRNPNISTQAAISIKNIKDYLNDSLKIEVKNKIDSLLFVPTKSLSFRGELFLSRFELFGNYSEHQSFLDKISIPNADRLQFYAKNPNTEIAAKKLIDSFMSSSCIKDKIDALPNIFDIKDKTSDTLSLKFVFLNGLSSDIPPLISVAADGIDSSFIVENSKELKEIISNQIENYKDNPDFLEATMSLVNLSKKIDNYFYNSMIEKVKSSKLYSIRKFIASKTGYKQIGFKELDKFEDIWNNSFKFNQATIKTSKGNVVIEFNSKIAPISVANFCMLVQNNFYNEIIFHRVVPGFVIQAGDPTATGWGGPGYDIVSEFSDTDFGIGYVGMASAGKDTENSQFFIMQGSYPHLDSRYTLFAKVTDGMDVVYNITEDDKIISIKLE